MTVEIIGQPVYFMVYSEKWASHSEFFEVLQLPEPMPVERPSTCSAAYSSNIFYNPILW